MSVTDTLLIFVAVPLAVVVVIAALGYVGNRGGSGDKRYRPGRHFDFAPVWFVSHPEQLVESGRAEITDGERSPALTTAKLEVAGAATPAMQAAATPERRAWRRRIGQPLFGGAAAGSAAGSGRPRPSR